MSKITSIIDGFLAFLQETLPDHKEHINPYALELNDSMTLEKGFSFFLGGASNSNEMSSCMLSIEREVVLNLTLRVYGAREDGCIRREVEKELMETQFSIIKAMENDPTLQSLIELIEFVGDNGMELIFGEEVSFISLRSNFTFRYYERLDQGE